MLRFDNKYLKHDKKKWVSKKIKSTNQKCPKCKVKSNDSVLPCGGDFWYCKNPECLVIDFSDVGYYIQDKNGNQVVGMHKKEPYGELQEDDMITGITCRKCNQPITKRELNESLKAMIFGKDIPSHNCPTLQSRSNQE